MKLFDTIALVNWEMGSFLIAIFGIVCAGLIFIVYKMVNSGKDQK